MQIIGMPGALCRASKLVLTELSDEARRRLDVLERVELEKARGLTVADACGVVGITRPTYYRWKSRLDRHGPKGLEPVSRRPKHLRRRSWNPWLVMHVKQLRKQYGWGKEKLTPLLRDEGFTVSESTVGRILSRLIHRGEVPVSPLVQAWKNGRRSSVSRPHAMHMPKGFKARLPGDL
ncbi:MAG: helix-turn-helix domain-containing protein, partial [Gammaproteobacteria bacterium]